MQQKMQAQTNVVDLREFKRKKFGCDIADKVDGLLEAGEKFIAQNERAEKFQKIFVYFIAPIYVFLLIVQAVKNF